MSYFVNKITVLGNVTDEPKLKKLKNGGIMTNFFLYTERSWHDQNGMRQIAEEFHNVVIFGSFAEVCEKVISKGDKVYVDGAIETVAWENDDGTKGEKKQIRAQNIVFLGQRTTDEELNLQS